MSSNHEGWREEKRSAYLYRVIAERGIGTSGNLRAAAFGINDGLISNLLLILGVAGASSNSSIILPSGVAGLLAGAVTYSVCRLLGVTLT